MIVKVIRERRGASARANRGRVLTAGVLVGFVLAVRFTVAEELLVDALAVTTRQFPLGADRFVGPQDGQDLTGLCKRNPR